MGTVNVLEAARINGRVKGIIVASSDKAYGKTDKAYTEESPLRADHPYDVSKASADLISQAYFATYGLPVVVTRFGNVYGEGDLHFGRIIPDICESIIKKKVLRIRSDGTYVRDYIYVKDVVNGYLFLLKNINRIKGEAFNFSSSDTLSVLDLVKKAEKILKVKISYKSLNNAKNEIPYQHLDDSKIKNLGWKSAHLLKKTLPNILQWYKEILKGL
jgi:CDP-glucose 4,6-dehydratase